MTESTGFALAIVVLLIFRVHLVSIDKRVAVLSRLDYKLDLLLKHAGIEYQPFNDLPRQTAEALLRGEKIQAIKHYREATGAGLKDAKDFVETIQRRAP